MNNKRIKKVRKIIKNNYSNLLEEAKKMVFIDRFLFCFEVLFKIKKSKLNVINKK